MSALRRLWALLALTFVIASPAWATMPTVVAAGTFISAASGTSITPTIPLQGTNLDTLICAVNVANNATVSTPSGWFSLTQTNSGASFHMATFARTYAAGNPAFTWTGSVKNSAQCWVVRGVDFGNANNGTAATGSTSTVTSSSVTTTLPETLALEIYGATAATGLAAPTGWTQESTATGSVTAISLMSKPIATAGATGATSSTGAAAAWVTVQVILPASVPTPNDLVFDNNMLKNGKVNGTNGFDEEDDFATSRIVVGGGPNYRNKGASTSWTIAPGDNLGFSGERAELSFADLNGGFKDNVYAATGTRCYGMSVMAPIGWQSPIPDPTAGGIWGIILQLHTPAPYGDVSPPIALYMTDHYSLYLNTGNIDSLGPYHATEYRFNDNGTINPGQWEDFVLCINFQQTATGSVQIWRRTGGAANFRMVLNLANIATMAYQPTIDGGTALPEYWHIGYYRSATSTFTTTLYTTGLAYGKTFAAAEKAAFGTNVGPGNGNSALMKVLRRQH